FHSFFHPSNHLGFFVGHSLMSIGNVLRNPPSQTHQSIKPLSSFSISILSRLQCFICRTHFMGYPPDSRSFSIGKRGISPLCSSVTSGSAAMGFYSQKFLLSYPRSTRALF